MNTNAPKLHVDLVPKTCWFSNVRSQVTNSDWDILRKSTYKKANHQCEMCHAKGKMEAHEIWHYDDMKKIQKLFGLICLCNQCHQIFHLGLAEINGKLPQVTQRLAKINNWSIPQTKEYINIVFEIWFDRSKYKWKLDLSFLDNLNIRYSLVPSEERKNII